jgi:radical SAM/Cys-rich protein
MASGEVETLQVNLGRKCNLACKHCHVEAGPGRGELMDGETVDAVLRALRLGGVRTLDITGGAPELNPRFRRLVEEAAGLGSRVMARSNLTVFFEEGMEYLPGFYASHGVEVVASLPYYLEENVDRVRGGGTFLKSIEAVRVLNALGYADGSGRLVLDLVYNPPGAFLPPAQATMQEEYKRELGLRYGVSFDRLFSLANMPIGRFREFLLRTGRLEGYMEKLSCAFNPDTLHDLMCRSLISVAWDGTLHDCDFNQVLGLGLADGLPGHIRDFDREALSQRAITVDEHCYGCTAGQGST